MGRGASLRHALRCSCYPPALRLRPLACVAVAGLIQEKCETSMLKSTVLRSRAGASRSRHVQPTQPNTIEAAAWPPVMHGQSLLEVHMRVAAMNPSRFVIGPRC